MREVHRGSKHCLRSSEIRRRLLDLEEAEAGREGVLERMDRRHMQIACKGVETWKIMACSGNSKS